MTCALAAALGFAVAGAAEGPALPEIAMQQGDLTLSVKAAKIAGVVNVLEGCGPFTVFAPVDCAWAGLTKPTQEELLNPCNKIKLMRILAYHTVSARQNLSDFENSKCCPIVLKTLSGGTLTISKKGSDWYVDGAKILGEGIPAKNGVLFKIDKVLIPPGMRVEQRAE